MKVTIIHPVSAILGGAIVAGLFMVTGAQEVTGRTAVELPAPATALGDVPLKIVGIPLPSDYYNLREADHSPSEGGGPAFLVGDDEIFIVTAIGSEPGGGTDPHLRVNDVVVLRGGSPGVMEEILDYFIVPPGSSMIIGDGSGATQTGIVWGYVLRE